MKEKALSLVKDYIRDDIELLEKNKEKTQRKINKLVSNYQASDIDKLTKLSNEINQYDYTIARMYALIGGMNRIDFDVD